MGNSQRQMVHVPESFPLSDEQDIPPISIHLSRGQLRFFSVDRNNIAWDKAGDYKDLGRSSVSRDRSIPILPPTYNRVFAQSMVAGRP